ncbi:hypothetical protein MMC30_009053 [Trapelia coarctata]|nr:hypothetical protein [Trapelia coarctata]
MDSQFAFASRDDLWRLQNEVKGVYTMQAEHLERISRLERRQEEDSRLKSVWGTSSPFPSILGGTPQQDPGYNPAAEAFKNFDQDQSSTLLGSLHLDTEDEPRRGASRANSVRFDESALHGHFGHGSRSSSDFFPLRTGSGLGGHPMTERSSSHKSDGRQSAMSQSNHSARLNSLGLEGRNSVLGTPASMGPPPGLFHLGPLPSIIRCWLDDNFTNDSLLYAAICTGSCRSVLATRLVHRLGLDDQLANRQGESKVKIQVYLPEATIQHSSTRSGSPTPQLPSITVDFFVQDIPDDSESIQIFIGSDVLRAKSADIQFSQDRLTMFDDNRNKLAIPLVRPENAAMFQNLVTINSPPANLTYTTEPPHTDYSQAETTSGLFSRSEPELENRNGSSQPAAQLAETKAPQQFGRAYSPLGNASHQPSVIGEGRTSSTAQEEQQPAPPAGTENHANGPASVTEGATPDTLSRTETGNMWGSWRRDSTQPTRPDSTFSSIASNTGYQRAGRGRGMKVLKSSRSSASSRSASTAQAPPGFDSTPGRSSENNNTRVSQLPNNENAGNQALEPSRRSFSSEAKSPLQPVTNKTRSANPVGGASAFNWLNSSQQKQPSTSSE